MKTIKVGDKIIQKYHKGVQYIVIKLNTGYKNDCFETDIHEHFFIDNRFKSWTKVRKNKNEKLN